ncbi:MAG TPA: beta-N-acetylhexosaminidase [Burkholderiaceae bacterium]
MNTAFHPGRLVMVDIPGKSLDAETAEFLRAHQIRAVCLFRKNLGSEEEIRQLTADLRAVMGDKALIGIDQEGGSVIRATSLPQAPAAMALGAIGDEALAEATGAAVARGLRYLGINWNFAPVLDINNNPANPVIAERSFGETAEAVTRLARAWMRGSLREGVACCAKHFPGHGDTHVDSHHALPTVEKSLAELEALELKPFAALAKADAKGEAVPAMMTAHIVYPKIDAEHPATLSHAVLTGILRERLGYEGVIITDALMMKAVYDRYGHARSAVLALQAGADMPLAQGSKPEQQASLDAVAAALAAGELDAAVLQKACARLDALAARYPAAPKTYSAEQRAGDDHLFHQAWADALCALRGAQAPAKTARIRVIYQGSVASDGVSEAGASAEQVRALFAGFADVEFLPLPKLRELSGADIPQDGRINVLVSNQRGRYYAAAASAKPDLHLALWNPFQVLDIAAPAVVSWGYAEGALAALRGWLRGEIEAKAKSPVTLK